MFKTWQQKDCWDLKPIYKKHYKKARFACNNKETLNKMAETHKRLHEIPKGTFQCV